MKLKLTLGTLLLCALLLAGCGGDSISTKTPTNQSAVEQVLTDQMGQADAPEAPATPAPSTDTTPAPESQSDAQVSPAVDYDLVEMGADLVYATIYQLMYSSENYIGKTFRVQGNFYSLDYDKTNTTYRYCMISDAAACCAQGLEFVMEGDSFFSPAKYPEEDTEIIVQGTFETYMEGTSRYCRLANATWEPVA